MPNKFTLTLPRNRSCSDPARLKSNKEDNMLCQPSEVIVEPGLDLGLSFPVSVDIVLSQMQSYYPPNHSQGDCNLSLSGDSDSSVAEIDEDIALCFGMKADENPPKSSFDVMHV